MNSIHFTLILFFKKRLNMDKLSRLKLFATCTGSKKLYDKIINKEPLSEEEKEQVKIINYKYSKVFDSEYLNIALNNIEEDSLSKPLEITPEETPKKCDDSVELKESEQVKDTDVKDTIAPIETNNVDDTNETSPIDIDTQE